MAVVYRFLVEINVRIVFAFSFRMCPMERQCVALISLDVVVAFLSFVDFLCFCFCWSFFSFVLMIFRYDVFLTAIRCPFERFLLFYVPLDCCFVYSVFQFRCNFIVISVIPK